MTESFTSVSEAKAVPVGGSPLAFDLDVDICVVGAGLAGLSVALEAARLGASVAVLEARQVGWNASGHQLGTVMPGFPLPLTALIERVGREDARELWALARQGVELVRANVAGGTMPGLSVSEGVLEVSNTDNGDRLVGRLRMLREDFDTEVEHWQVDRVRGALNTNRYFHGLYYPRSFQLDGRQYVHGLAELARRAGVRIFEGVPVVSLDPSGIRKRVVTPSARVRADHVVLAGNVHLGAPMPQLSETLLPVWRHAALTAPLGERLAQAVAFSGSVIDCGGVDHFRIVDGDRLLWVSPETTWAARPEWLSGAIKRRIRAVFPQLGDVALAQVFSGAIGETVHGMPQIGELRDGLWVASGFGRQGMNTATMAGHLIARSIVLGDDRWRLFLPFELVWAGGRAGRLAGQLIVWWTGTSSAAMGTLARYRERAQLRKSSRQKRAAEAGSARPTPRGMPASSERAVPTASNSPTSSA